MKKKNFSYLVVIVILLVAAVLLSGSTVAQADDTFILVINILPDNLAGSVVFREDSADPPYEEGDVVYLKAEPSDGYVFSHWLDSQDNIIGFDIGIDIEIKDNTEITAVFQEEIVPPTCYSLKATANPAAGGTVDYRLGDEVCGAPEELLYEDGANFILSATANPGYRFVQWVGDLPITVVDPTVTSFEITMDKNRTLTAEFAKACQKLTLSKNNGQGAVPTAEPVKRSCDGEYEFKAGESTTLRAAPDPGWKVSSWKVGQTTISTSSNTYNLVMPALPYPDGLVVEVSYIEKATFGFSSADQSVVENEGKIDIVIERKVGDLVSDDATTIPIQFKTVNDDAMAPQDYIAKTGTLSFTKGQLFKTISIKIENDNITEGQESFFVELTNSDSNIKLGQSTIEVQIDDDEGPPSIRFEEPVYTVGESATSVEVAVVVSPLPQNGDVYVELETRDGTAVAGMDGDYKALSDLVKIPVASRGQSRATVLIELHPDDLDELDEETIHLFFTDSDNAELPIKEDPNTPDAVVRILDDDDPPSVEFSDEEYFVKKAGNQKAFIPVKLSERSGQLVTIDYKATLESTGASNEGVLTFNGKETESLEIPITAVDPEDVIDLQLSNPQNAELGDLNAARLYILNTDINDCHDLTFSFSGYGQAPSVISKASSLGCPAGQYVAGELVEVDTLPDRGWYVAAWEGTIDDESGSLQNTVEMPDSDFTINAAYRIPLFFSIVNKAEDPFAGPAEKEPNNLFSQANGPLLFNKDYLGSFSEDSDMDDLYYFQLAQATTVAITLKDIPNGRDYDLVLYDETWIDGKIIAESREFDNDPEEIIMTLSPRKYFLQVHAGGSKPSSATYRLRIRVN